jgi:AraC-like DNA-binding protein
MNVPLVYLCAFSIFLSLTLLFYNKGYKGANLFLSGYLFCSSAFLLTQYILIYSKSISLIAFSVSGIPSLFFLIGPFAYFYVRSILRDTVKLSKADFLHFLPFLLIFIGAIPFLFSSWEYKFLLAKSIAGGEFMQSKHNINFLIPKIVNQLIRPPYAMLYLVLISREFFRNIDIFKSFSHAKVVKIWLGLFFMVFSVVVVFYIIVQFTFYLKIKFLFDNLWVYYLLNSIAFVYLAFNFSLILFPQILYGLPISKLVIDHNDIHIVTKPIQNNNDTTIPIIENKLATLSAFFSKEYEIEIESIINNWIAEKKYLEVNASLVTFSKYTNIPVHHLSYYFNSILKVKYTDWRNTLRIEYAKSKIDSGSNKLLTLEALSLESGFSSQSTFIRSFKYVFNCTPSDYIKTKN